MSNSRYKQRVKNIINTESTYGKMLLWGEEDYQQKKVLHEAYDDSDCKIFIKCHNKKAKQETSILQIKKNEKKELFASYNIFYFYICSAFD